MAQIFRPYSPRLKPVNKVAIDPAAAIQGGFWRLNNIHDDAGLNNAWTRTGTITPTVSPFGEALTFDGTSGFLTVPNAPANQIEAQPLTVWAWVKVNDATRGGYIVSKGNNIPNSGFHLVVGSTGEFLGFGTIGSTNGMYGVDVAPVLDGNWHQIVATWDGNMAMTGTAIYIDGVARAQTTIGNGSTQDAADTFDLLIGRNVGGSSRDPAGITPFFAGAIDHVGFDRRVYSAAEILRLYNEPFWFLAPPEGEMPALFVAAAPPPTGVNFTNLMLLGVG